MKKILLFTFIISAISCSTTIVSNETKDCSDIDAQHVQSINDISSNGTIRWKAIIEVSEDADSADVVDRMQCTALRIYNEMGKGRVAVMAFKPNEEISIFTLKYTPNGDWHYQGDETKAPFQFVIN